MLLQQRSESSRFATTLPRLDDALRGGLPSGGITELVGPAGVGKTQVCMMLAAMMGMPVAVGGGGGGVLYIDTETKFSSARLVEIAVARFPHSLRTDADVEELTSRVVVVTPTSSAHMLQVGTKRTTPSRNILHV
jgi:RAD51-like protein 1